MTNLQISLNELSFNEVFQCQARFTEIGHFYFNKKRYYYLFSFLCIIQLISTLLLLLSISNLVKGINADTQLINTSRIFSGNMRFEEELLNYRYKRNLNNVHTETKILNKIAIDSICTENRTCVNRFKALLDYKLQFCDIFDVLSVLYSFLISKSDLVDMNDNVTFPSYDIHTELDDSFIKMIPSQLLIMQRSGKIFASKSSVQALIYRHFSTANNCQNILEAILNNDREVNSNVSVFGDILLKNHCIRFMTSELYSNTTHLKIICDECKKTYKNWLCTEKFDLFISIIPKDSSSSLSSSTSSTNTNSMHNLSSLLPDDYLSSSKSSAPTTHQEPVFYPKLPLQSSQSQTSSITSDNKQNQSALIGIKSCRTWCSKVETYCPYFTPVDGNGGEPAFLCDESHYHHSSRYQSDKTTQCNGKWPWYHCCYSEQILVDKQRSKLSTEPISAPSYNHRIDSTNTGSNTNSDNEAADNTACYQEQLICLRTLTKYIYDKNKINFDKSWNNFFSVTADSPPPANLQVNTTNNNNNRIANISQSNSASSSLHTNAHMPRFCYCLVVMLLSIIGVHHNLACSWWLCVISIVTIFSYATSSVLLLGSSVS